MRNSRHLVRAPLRRLLADLPEGDRRGVASRLRADLGYVAPVAERRLALAIRGAIDRAPPPRPARST
jgi:hypothetical protein